MTPHEWPDGYLMEDPGMDEFDTENDNIDDLPSMDEAPMEFDDDQIDLDDLDLDDAFSDSDTLPPLDMGDDAATPGSDDLSLSLEDDAIDGAPAVDAEPTTDIDFETSDEEPLDLDDLDLGEIGEGMESGDGDDLGDLGTIAVADDDFGDVADDMSMAAEGEADSDPGADFAMSDEEDESVALSQDELENILGTSDDSFFEDLSDAPDSVEEATEGAATEDDDFDMDSAEIPSVELDPIAPEDNALPAHEEMSFDDFDSSTTDIAADDDETAGFSAPDGIMEDDDDEPIALSADELENIIGDSATEGEVQEGLTPGEDDFAFEDADAGEDDVLPDLELEEMPDLDAEPTPEIDGEASMEEPVIDGMPPGEDDENITLSDDELSAVLLDEDEATDHSHDFDDVPDAPSLASLEMDEEEPIALTPEELGSIVEEVDETEEHDGVEPDVLEGLGDEPLAGESDGGFDGEEFGSEFGEDSFATDLEEDDGPVALSTDELGSILEDVDGEPEVQEGVTPDDTAFVDDDFALDDGGSLESTGDHEEEHIINLDEYDEIADDGAAAPASEPAAAATAVAESPAAEQTATAVADEEGLDREELRRVIGYLDRLFDQLPESTIREFSRSEYFDLYKKIMGELEL